MKVNKEDIIKKPLKGIGAIDLGHVLAKILDDKNDLMLIKRMSLPIVILIELKFQWH